MSPPIRPSFPPLLKLLARLGLVFGALNAMVIVAMTPLLFADREQLVEAYREQVEAQASPSPSPSPEPKIAASPSPSPSPAPELFAKVPGQAEAEEFYSRRGWMVPLAGIAFILSMLLLLGCLRALRGMAWGVSAWTTSCALMVPFHVLNVVLLRVFFGALPPSAYFAGSVGFVYSIVCVLYLRQQRVRALFKS